MTKAEWLSCADPEPMLEFVRGKASERKLRLFAAAGFRRLVGLLPDPRQRQGIDILEKWAEGAVTRSACRSAVAEVRQAIPPDDGVAGTQPTDDHHYVALMLYREFNSSSVAIHAVTATRGLADMAAAQREQVRLMACIFNNPFRPSPPLPPAILAWHDSTIPRIAEGIYEERAFDRLPILADALLDAGCDNEELLAHCRSDGPHVRGCCWAVDLILGKS